MSVIMSKFWQSTWSIWKGYDLSFNGKSPICSKYAEMKKRGNVCEEIKKNVVFILRGKRKKL